MGRLSTMPKKITLKKYLLKDAATAKRLRLKEDTVLIRAEGSGTTYIFLTPGKKPRRLTFDLGEVEHLEDEEVTVPDVDDAEGDDDDE